MDANLRPLVSHPHIFFSDNIIVRLRFGLNGSIDGWLVHYSIGLNLAQMFRGIWAEEDGIIKFSFFIEWRDVNLKSAVLTAYSGAIVKPVDKTSSLSLEWLQVNEDRLSIEIVSYEECEILRRLSKELTSQTDPIGSYFLKTLEESFKHR